MPKRVLDVGNCGPDHAALVSLLQRYFDVTIVQAHGMDDALTCLREEAFDLVTVNRVMDKSGASGLEIIAVITKDERLNSVPVMMITNFPEHQESAVRSGAVHGFGKKSLDAVETVERLRNFLA
jgi:two-component system chemotaxis response regulator CheY